MATVLVADDDPGVRYALKRLLTVEGDLEVVEADGCEAALELMASENPDVVVTEAVMPSMTAIDYIKALRWACPRAGIVALSAGGMHQSPEFATGLASTAGADEVLRKPARNDSLLTAVNNLLR